MRGQRLRHLARGFGPHVRLFGEIGRDRVGEPRRLCRITAGNADVDDIGALGALGLNVRLKSFNAASGPLCCANHDVHKFRIVVETFGSDDAAQYGVGREHADLALDLKHAASLCGLVGARSFPTACKSVGSMRICVTAVYLCGTRSTKRAASRPQPPSTSGSWSCRATGWTKFFGRRSGEETRSPGSDRALRPPPTAYDSTLQTFTLISTPRTAGRVHGGPPHAPSRSCHCGTTTQRDMVNQFIKT